MGVKRSKMGERGGGIFSEKRGWSEKRKGGGGELIHLSALCFVIVIFYVFGA